MKPVSYGISYSASVLLVSSSESVHTMETVSPLLVLDVSIVTLLPEVISLGNYDEEVRLAPLTDNRLPSSESPPSCVAVSSSLDES